MTTFNPNPDRKELRNFGLITGAMTAAVFGLILPLLFSLDLPKWPWVVAGVLIAWALAAPLTLKPLYRVWMTIGQALGWVNTRIIMTIMYYLLILPVGLGRRLLGKDPMARTLSRDDATYRVTSSVPDKNHLENPY